jgi:hypothetical protein
MDKPTHNQHCLKDGKPCAADGNGGCQCCDDNKGGYNYEPVDTEGLSSQAGGRTWKNLNFS